MLASPISELYFLIAKFLSGGPLKETAKVIWLRIPSCNDYMSSNVVIVTVSVADTAKRARDDRGRSELFLVPGLSLYCCFGCGRTWLRLSNSLKLR